MSSGLRDARVLQAFTQGVQRPYMLGVEQRLTDVVEQLAPNVVAVSKVSSFNTSSTTAVDVPGMTLTITTTGGPLLVVAAAEAFYVSHTAAATGEFALSFDGLDVWVWQHETQGNTSRNAYGLAAVRLFATAAGTHTIVGRARTNQGTLNIDAGSDYPAQLMAVEL